MTLLLLLQCFILTLVADIMLAKVYVKVIDDLTGIFMRHGVTRTKSALFTLFMRGVRARVIEATLSISTRSYSAWSSTNPIARGNIVTERCSGSPLTSIHAVFFNLLQAFLKEAWPHQVIIGNIGDW